MCVWKNQQIWRTEFFCKIVIHSLYIMYKFLFSKYHKCIAVINNLYHTFYYYDVYKIWLELKTNLPAFHYNITYNVFAIKHCTVECSGFSYFVAYRYTSLWYDENLKWRVSKNIIKRGYELNQWCYTIFTQ